MSLFHRLFGRTNRRNRRATPRKHLSVVTRSSFRLEPLEERTLLTVSLSLSGAQTITAAQNIDVTNNSSVQHSEMTVAVNPANSLNVAGFTHHITSSGITEIDVYYSTTGGNSWTLTPITGSVDGQSSSATRFDPSIAFDHNGNLFVGYGVDDTYNTSLLVDESTNGGASFSRFSVIDTRPDLYPGTQNDVPGVDKWQITTGLDPSSHNQAVYVAYTQNVIQNGAITNQRIAVAGSNNGGATFTAPEVVNDASINGNSLGNSFADPAVGPSGQLYVSWESFSTNSILFDTNPLGLWGSSSFGTDVTAASLSTPMDATLVPAQPQRGIENAPVIAVDDSGGAYNGRLYIAYTDASSSSNLPNTTINVITSSNAGVSWSAPTAIAGGSETNFLPWITVDQFTGSVDVDYYSTAAGSSTSPVNVEIAESINGGATFPYIGTVTTATSDATQDPYQGNFLEYIGLAMFEGTAHAFWADNRSSDNSTDFESYTASVATASSGNTLTINGDSAGESFLIRMDPTNSSYLDVQVNGVDKFVGLLGSIGKIVINGASGSGTNLLTVDGSYGDPIPSGGVTFNGTGQDTLSVEADANFTLGSAHVTLTGNEPGSISTSGVTSAGLVPQNASVAHTLTVNGWSGTANLSLSSNDTATLDAPSGSSGNSFTASPTSTTLAGAGYSYSTSFGAAVNAIASSPTDSATLQDTGKTGTLYAYGNQVTFSGTGYSIQATSFGSITATSAGGTDSAFIYDYANGGSQSGRNILDATTGPNTAMMAYWNGTIVKTVSFRSTTAYHTYGSPDTATQAASQAAFITLAGTWYHPTLSPTTQETISGALVAYDASQNLFAIGSDGFLRQDNIPNHSGQFEVDAVTRFTAGAPVVDYNDGNINLFAVGQDGYARWIQYGSAGWTNWFVFDRNTTFKPGTSLIGSSTSGYLNLFGVGSNGYIWQDQYNTGTHSWSGFFQVNPSLKFDPGTPLVIYATGAIEMFGVLPNGQVGQVAFTNGWGSDVISGSQNALFSADIPLTIYVDSSGHYNLFGVNSNGDVADVYWPNGSSWGVSIVSASNASLASGAPLALYVSGNGNYNLFGANKNGQISQIVLYPQGGGTSLGAISSSYGFVPGSQLTAFVSSNLDLYGRGTSGHLLDVKLTSSWNEYDLG